MSRPVRAVGKAIADWMNRGDTVLAPIRRFCDGGTDVSRVEYDMCVVMGNSDRVVVLNHDQLIAEGPPAAVRRDPAMIGADLGASDTAAATHLEAGGA